jgi:hypothetical protein
MAAPSPNRYVNIFNSYKEMHTADFVFVNTPYQAHDEIIE